MPDPEPGDDGWGVTSVEALIEALGVQPLEGDRFTTTAPDWWGERIFGGLLVAHALHAALRTVTPSVVAHSVHTAFLGPVRSGPVELVVERLRDGRTFRTRQVRTLQDGRETTRTTVSFHHPETGPDYQQPMPAAPPPEAFPPDEEPDPFEMRDVGGTQARADGSHESSGRLWQRVPTPLPDEPVVHLLLAAFLSDMTGQSFRPHSPGDWGTHVDASIDHALWLHRPFRVDEWLLSDFHVIASAGARSTVRGAWFDRQGRVVMSMGQELLIRRLA